MLTPSQIREANHDRANRWRLRLISEGATAVCAIGIVQTNTARSPFGMPVVCMLEDGLTERELASLLRYVADQLEAGTVEERQ